MRHIALTNIDTAGGLIKPSGNNIGGQAGVYFAVKGDPVQGHGDSPHNASVMAEGSSLMRVNGIPVVLEGHKATCGHAATGSCVIRVSD